MQYNHLLFLYSTTEITPGKAVILLSDCGFNFKSNWNRLTSILNVPVELKGKMRAIIKEDEAYDYAMEIALDWWIKNTSEASWKELISSVDRCGEIETAHAMRKKLSEEGKQASDMGQVFMYSYLPVLLSKNCKSILLIFEKLFSYASNVFNYNSA